MQFVGKVQKLFFFAFHKLGDRNARPLRNDFCDFVGGNFVTEQRSSAFGFFLGFLEFFGQGRQGAVLKLGRFAVVAAAFCVLDLKIDAVDFGLGVLHAVYFFLFVFPLRLHFVELIVKVCKFFFD